MKCLQPGESRRGQAQIFGPTKPLAGSRQLAAHVVVEIEVCVFDSSGSCCGRGGAACEVYLAVVYSRKS
jgi:hypothetical protein